ncbi:MAG TPA: CPBP family intramembrane glutamic endopeptidase [Dyella sp.]|uniref:CPBP family intramembrane glutamic endopeptidase n=1 Tax=Dyella sp. TaxID=1869338 RepID=UPI002B76DA97|nr:CPBP family intramembrane glutamic endopeptidase [Dyella sp.]HUB91864.1 CPBP family intramembrane glutamic endopeptidase [Dyella sp.]
MRAFILSIFLVCLCAPVLAQAPIPTDVLRTPEQAVVVVSASEQDAYRRVMSAYALAEKASPQDAALVMARCRFAQGFLYNEEIDWTDTAQDDFQRCKNDLQTRFPDDAEADLFIAQQQGGKDVIAFALTLLPKSAHWSLQQRAKLHGILARGYTATKQTDIAGQEALAAVQMDPASDQLVTALRYLANSGRAGEAEALLAKTPVDASIWKEWSRVNFAADSLSPTVALAELRRAMKNRGYTNWWLAARIYLRAGKAAEAVKALAHVGGCSCSETIQQYQTRLDVAVAARDGTAASTVLQSWLAKTGISMPLLFAYGNLLRHDPLQLFSPPLVHLALGMLALLLTLAYAPSLIAFPAYYRGVIRARRNKPSVPLFANIGLRCMWMALAIFLVASAIIPLLGGGSPLHSWATSKVLSNDEQSAIVVMQLATLLMGGVLMAPIAWRFSRRDWLGDRGWITTVVVVALWALVKALGVWLAWHSGHLGAAVRGTLHDRMIATLALACAHLGGPVLAMLVIAVAVPVYEELIFRGCVLGGLARHISFGWANVVQALLFAVLHNDTPHFVFYFLLGLLGGWLARRTRGLAAPIALHAANNAVACAAIFLGG